ncbi:MAG: N(2)-fixation sustaining protein CowN [Halothece sp.]
MTTEQTDRYISFQGIDCDGKARAILNYIEQYVNSPPHHSPWLDYFQQKLRDRVSIGQDELHFVASQINNIQALFEDYEDNQALALLEKVEEECC